MPITSRIQRGCSFAARAEGLIGFAPHAVGISEDTWAVSQTAHNAMAFGARVKFLLSRAFWHKIRETWSHAEWLASFPRWSGGYLQMMHDPIMQRINDFGSSSVFAKEIRANSGRNFLTAPFALLNILLMPLAILLDLAPFVQILVVLWKPMGNWIVIPKTLAWLAAFLFYTIISILIGNGGALAWLGSTLGLTLLAAVLVQGAKYLRFRRELGKLAQEAERLLVASGIEGKAAQKLAREILQIAGNNPAQIAASLERANVPLEKRSALLHWAQEKLGAALREPVQDLPQDFSFQSRAISEFKRAFVLALLVLVWFFIVPVPGLFVFTAAEYRISVKMGAILTGMLSAIGVVLAGFWIGRVVQWLDREGVRDAGLRPRAAKAYRAFESLLALPNRLTPQEISSLFALFADLKTYLDQRSYAYAWRTLGQAEALLRASQPKH